VDIEDQRFAATAFIERRFGLEQRIQDRWPRHGQHDRGTKLANFAFNLFKHGHRHPPILFSLSISEPDANAEPIFDAVQRLIASCFPSIG
jgi:hypothetical protein